MGCESNVPPGKMCGKAHCGNFLNTSDAKAYCDCINWKGERIPGCVPRGANDPINTNECYNKVTHTGDNISFEECLARITKDPNTWTWRECSCCCSCYAWYTQIAISQDEVRYIQDFEIGDVVLAASVVIENGGPKLTWDTREVSFSDGTSPNPQGQEMIVVQYGAPDLPGEVTATNDQLFLMPDGKLKRADRLQPSESLVRPDGTLVQIVAIKLGR